MIFLKRDNSDSVISEIVLLFRIDRIFNRLIFVSVSEVLIASRLESLGFLWTFKDHRIRLHIVSSIGSLMKTSASSVRPSSTTVFIITYTIPCSLLMLTLLTRPLFMSWWPIAVLRVSRRFSAYTSFSCKLRTHFLVGVVADYTRHFTDYSNDNSRIR